MTNSMAEARQAHLEKYGSIIYCPDRDTLCSFMDNAWETGCAREGGCILDDPEDQALQARIKKSRQEKERLDAEEREAEHIRNQKNEVRNHIDRQMQEVHRLEKMSQEAFRNNRPNKGHELFNKAKFLRFETFEYAKKHGVRI